MSLATVTNRQIINHGSDQDLVNDRCSDARDMKVFPSFALTESFDIAEREAEFE
jgi:hypothetical protein